MDARARNLIQKLSVPDDKYSENLVLTLELCKDKGKKLSFLRGGLIGVLYDPAARMFFNNNKVIIANIVEELSTEWEWTIHIAIEANILNHGLNVLFHYVRPMVVGANLYTEMIRPDSTFFEHSQDDFHYIKHNLLTLVNLVSNEESIIREIAKFNVVPKFLFIIEKIHTGMPPNFAREIAVPCKKSAIILLIKCFRLKEVADRTCIDYDVLKWYFRVLNKSIISVIDSGLAQSLALLSASMHFTPVLDDQYIIRDWTYGTLCQILVPEMRTQEWYEANPRVIEEEYTIAIMDYLLTTLVNTSTTHGGVQEIIYAIFHHKIDITWRSFYIALQFKKIPTRLMMVCLNLANNLLRYPGYSPPDHSSVIALRVYGELANTNQYLLIMANRAFRLLPFNPPDKQKLCMIIGQKLMNSRHRVELPPLPQYKDLEPKEYLERDIEAVAIEWNSYFEGKNEVWESFKVPEGERPNFESPQEEIIHNLIREMKRVRVFFKRLPNTCKFCEEFNSPPMYHEDKFWKYFRSQIISEENDGMEHYISISIIQFLTDLTDNEDIKFIFENVMANLNPVLLLGNSDLENKTKSAIIMYYYMMSEILPGFVHAYLASRMIYFHEYQVRIILNQVSQKPPTMKSCEWNATDNFFALKSTAPSKNKYAGLPNQSMHVLVHLLDLLRIVIKNAPEVASKNIRKQAVDLLNLNYELVLTLYPLIVEGHELEELGSVIISGTEEIEFVIIRKFPEMFYSMINNVVDNKNLFPIYIDLSTEITNQLFVYSHITTLYLFIARDQSQKLALKILDDALQDFSRSVSRVMRKLCLTATEISKRKENISELRVDKGITLILEKITLVKSTHYLILSMLHLFLLKPNAIESLGSTFYQKLLEKLGVILRFAEKEFKGKALEEDTFQFPSNFKSSQIKNLPWTRAYIVIDFELEDEDTLFANFFSSVMSWIWQITQSKAICEQFVGEPDIKYVLTLALSYERWNLNSYMAVSASIYNFAVFFPFALLNHLNISIDIVVKFISGMKIPLEAYFLLFQVLREIYPRIINPVILNKLQGLVAPLRTVLSTDLPVLKFYNYPLLEPNDNEEIMQETTFPVALMAKLADVLSPMKAEMYTGQAALQAEVRSMIKLLTPIKEVNLKEVRRKVFKKSAPEEEVKSAEHRTSRNRFIAAGKNVINKPSGLISHMNRLPYFDEADYDQGQRQNIDDIYTKLLEDEFYLNYKG